MCRTDIVTITSAPASSVRPRGVEAALLIWDDVWYRNLFLVSVLVALVFLMALSIFLASTRPTVPSTPETRAVPSGSTAFVQTTVESPSVPAVAWSGPTVEG